MPRCSDIINYPEPMSSVPLRHTGVTEISALIAVIALLDEVVDLIESLQLGSHHLSFFKRKDRAQAAAQKKLCDGIVNAANSLTELFNQSPFKDHLYPYLKPARKFKTFVLVIQQSLTSSRCRSCGAVLVSQQDC
jgi:hypothetical protein